MGLLDDLAGTVTGAANAANAGTGAGGAGDLLSGIGGMLAGLTGGANGGIVDQLLSLVRDPNGGGLQGLVSQLQAGGLGDQVKSWISTGDNLPVSGDQITAALGGDRVQQLAQGAGIDVAALAPKLAELLPAVIDRLTPDGTLPGAGA